MMGSVSRYDLVMYNVMMPDGGTYYCKARQGDELLLLATYTVSVSKGRLVGYTQQQYLSLVAGVYTAAVFVTCCWGIPSSRICHLLVGYTQQQYLSLVRRVYPAAVFVTCFWGIPSSSICHLLLGYTQQQYLSLVAGVYSAVFVTCCWGIPSSICHLLLSSTFLGC